MLKVPEPTPIPLLPNSPEQNPAPFTSPSQDQMDKIQVQTQKVMEIFRQILPSNYVSQINGPYYSLQFQAMAEQIAKFQITAQEVFQDASYDYTRSEVLYQILGMLVFPDASVSGWPILANDLQYRAFLRNMVTLLLQGATKETIKEGVELLTEATVEVIERGIAARLLKGKSAWGPDDEFVFQIDVSKEKEIVVEGERIMVSTFPDDPVTLIKNIKIVMQALKPAHTLYVQRFLFKETYSILWDAIQGIEITSYYYDDKRRFCLGAKEINGTAGSTLTDRTLFSDPTRDFSSVIPGATLTITSGPNMRGGDGFVQTPAFTPETYPGCYRVESILYFPIDVDTAQSYTTSPTGLTGSASVLGDTLTDTAQDWSNCVEGEILTFSTGLNVGSYRLKTLCGNNGGAIGIVPSGSGVTQVKIAPSILRVQWPMLEATTGQSYTVGVDRLGCQVSREVSEDDAYQFIGVGIKDWLLTQHGPLVKSWGDATPASTLDVSVTLDGTPQEVSSINPYTGKITLVTPITMWPASETHIVLVEYYWMYSPIMTMAGLNTEGLVLNKWSNASGRNSTSLVKELGAMEIGRFPMRVTLGPLPKLEPSYTGWRYLGFEKRYSAILNDAGSLLLNQNPNITTKPGFSQVINGKVVVYEGTKTPIQEQWLLIGSDAGSVNVDTGTYTLIDNKSGAYDSGDPKLTTYFQEVDLTFPSSTNVIARYYISDYTLDGIFTGVAFGINDPEYLYLLGHLVINDVKHIGLLLDPTQPQLQTSWLLGPDIAGEIQPLTVSVGPAKSIKFLTTDLPSGLITGSRFQIMSGSQAGVYSIATMITDCTGYTTVYINETFPADPKLYGNKNVNAVFEVLWNNPFTYWITLNPVTQAISVRISGKISTQVFALDRTSTTFPLLASSILSEIMLSSQYPKKEEYGYVWWGSISTWATNTSVWSFLRYGIIPNQLQVNGQIAEATVPMDVLPETQTDKPWFLEQGLGYALINASSHLYLNKPVSSTANWTMNYMQEEPFFTPASKIDLETHFKVLTNSCGWGSCISLQDTVREARLGLLTFYENGSFTGTRRNLINFPSINMAGYLDPVSQGWEAYGTYRNHEQDLWITQTTTDTTWFKQALDTSTLPYSSGAIFEARLSITAYTGTLASPYFLACFPITSNKYVVYVRFGLSGSTPYVYLYNASATIVASYQFDWTDGNLHAYRITASAGGVTLTIDDVIQTPAAGIAPFQVDASNPTEAMFGVDSNATSTSYWRSFSFYEYADGTDINRTLGILKTGDPTNINNWEIPRSDSTSTPNSEVPLTDIMLVDWTTTTYVRILRTSTWGVTVFLPDYPPPPYYDPTKEITGGWINVEYPELPFNFNIFGTISFGATDSNSITWQEWQDLDYTIYQYSDGYFQPQNMVLNRYNVINSGELTEDVTNETVVVGIQTTTSVSLIPTHLFADFVWKVIDGTTVYTSNEWVFDKTSQTITLKKDAQNQQRFFQNQYVTVIFNPGKPVTNTYLTNQPLLDGITKLNEDVPPVPMGQGSLYSTMEFIPVTQGQTGLISPVCESGWGIGVAGTSYWNLINPLDDGTNGGTPPTQYFYASGGNFVGPVIDAEGNPIAMNNPLGGLLNQVILWPIGLPGASSAMFVTAGTETITPLTDTLIDCLTVISITPSSGSNTGPIDITDLEGAGFVDGASVLLRRSGQSDIIGSSVIVVDETQITCTFNLTGAVAGTWDVVVTNPDGASASLVNGFTVTGGSLDPVVISIDPNTGLNTGPIDILDLEGLNFIVSPPFPMVVLFNGGVIFATDVVVEGSTKITCTFDLTGATVGFYDVYVLNDMEHYGILPNGFTVTMIPIPAPTVTSIDPSLGFLENPDFATAIEGTNFVSGATVKIVNATFPSIYRNATGVSVLDSEHITCHFALTGGLLPGSYNVVVTNPDLQEGILLHGVTLATVPDTLIIIAIIPNNAPNTAPVSVDIYGSGFVDTYGGIFTNLIGDETIAGTDVVIIDPSHITCTFDLTGVIVGPYALQVRYGYGLQKTTAPGFFTVTGISPAPSIDSFYPERGRQNQIFPFSLIGSNFVSGASVKLEQGATTRTATPPILVPDSSHINCGLNLGIPLPLGVYQVIVTNPDAQEGVLDGFLVMEPLTVTDIDPNTGRNDDGALYATLTGTGLDALVTSVRLVLGAEIIEATDLDPTGHQLNCIFNLIGATTGVYDVVVSAEDGAEATLPNAFTVTEEFTLTGIDPTSGSDIEIVSVTITGGGFINDPAFSIALVREGYLAIVGVNINILDHGNLTCDFDLRGAEPGLWSLYANNGLGEEATLPDCFTITSSGSLTVTGINPTSAYTNETVPCTVYGGGFELAPISAVELHLGATSIPATEITVLNDTTLICTFYLAGMAFPGVWSLFVYNDTPEEAHLDDCFTIYDPPPEIGWIVPDNGSNDSPVTIDIYGGYFVDGITAVLFLGETSLVGDPVVFNTDGWITATFDTLDATPGIWSLRVTNPDMQDAILPDCFTLTASGSVTVTSIDPNHGPSGTTVVITDLHGTGFQDGATVRFNKTGREIYATNVVVLSENQITCEFPIPPGANGIWNITVTNPDFSWGQMLEGFTSGF